MSAHPADGPAAIAPALLAWFDRSGRHHLPWKGTPDPYRIWVSEIMLQQTQVATVVPYFERFMASFPDVASLAAADQDQVLAHWTGLGYYARARNLHRAARVVVTDHAGRFPRDAATLATLPGIGRSTAGAIAAMAYGERAPILDGNVKRVLTRLAAIEGWPGRREVEKRLWTLADALTPAHRVADYTQAIMDLGATVCTPKRPACLLCPLADGCDARLLGIQEALPTPRPKRALPERHGRLLLIERPDGRVLLTRRPAPGIWGGLWCFPQLDEERDAAGAAAELLGVPAGAISEGGRFPARSHTFTHFRIHLTPVHLRLERDAARIEDGASGWFDPAEEPPLALAAPVPGLLAALAADAPAPAR